MVGNGAVDENSNFCGHVFESLDRFHIESIYGFYRPGGGSTTSCMGKCLKHLKPKMGEMALGRPQLT